MKKYVILVLVLVVIVLSGIWYFGFLDEDDLEVEEELEKIQSVSVTKSEEGINKIKEYDDYSLYTKGISNIIIETDRKSYDIKEYLEEQGIEEFMDLFLVYVVSYDGGSTIYVANDSDVIKDEDMYIISGKVNTSLDICH